MSGREGGRDGVWADGSEERVGRKELERVVVKKVCWCERV
jgi:hypothetical protein